MKRTPSASKIVLGRVEHISLPDWGIADLPAKIDTGAKTSAVHVESFERIRGNRVRFEVIQCVEGHLEPMLVEARPIRWARVRSSNGTYTRRCFVRTTLKLGPIEKEIEISLVSREQMAYRMLLGREALHHDFIVDVSRRNVQRPKKKKPKRGSGGTV